jgi:hypothetical protein
MFAPVAGESNRGGRGAAGERPCVLPGARGKQPRGDEALAFGTMLLAVSDAVVTGGAALLGAIAGGAVTGYVTLRAEEKRQGFARKVEKRKAAAEAERERRAEQAAARLVLRELWTCNSALSAAVKGTRAGRVPDPRLWLPTEAWASEGKHLAGALPSDTWAAVAHAHLGIHSVRSHVVTTEKWPDASWMRDVATEVEEAAVQLAARLDAVEAQASAPREM